LADSCECGDEPSGSGSTELVSWWNVNLRGTYRFTVLEKTALHDLITIYTILLGQSDQNRLDGRDIKHACVLYIMNTDILAEKS
jgi:hypothetical protein